MNLIYYKLFYHVFVDVLLTLLSSRFDSSEHQIEDAGSVARRDLNLRFCVSGFSRVKLITADCTFISRVKELILKSAFFGKSTTEKRASQVAVLTEAVFYEKSVQTNLKILLKVNKIS